MRLQVLLVVLLLLPGVLAFGVSPARTVFDEPGVHEFAVRVLDPVGEVSARIDGPYADRFTIMDVQQDVIRGTISIPDEDDTTIPPGDHEHRVIVGAGSQGTATVELASIITLRKRFQGPYLTGTVHPSPDEGREDTTTAYVTLTNIGTKEVTPTSITIRANTEDYPMQSRAIAVGKSEQFSTKLSGRGAFEGELTVRGDAPLTLRFPLSLGIPIVEEFTVTPAPDESQITPLDVHIEVSWNAPVQGTLQIGEKAYDITIDGTLDERFYTEEESFLVELKIGRTSLTSDFDLTRPEKQERPRIPTKTPWIVALLVAVLVMILVLWRLLKK